jgi:pimeloyl-ACP methyl ester carboxylesterase
MVMLFTSTVFTFAQPANDFGRKVKSVAENKSGKLVTEQLTSSKLKNTRTGLDPVRKVKIYLPPGYETSGKSYPVIYFFHGLGSSSDQLFADGKLAGFLDKGFANGVVKEFVFVAADYSTPVIGSFFENSSTTGYWLDFTVEELIPFIDGKFRTIKNRESRGLAGESMGGYGALKFAMLYPELFNAVYALHPVATGGGLQPMMLKTNWGRILKAKSYDDVDFADLSKVFLGISQAYLPNPNRPPFYCDFLAEMENGVPTFNAANSERLNAGFGLNVLLQEKAANLRRVKGIAFDWARYDPIQDHVYGAQAFTRLLDGAGIKHEAEEYRGVQWEENWSENGRFYTRLLPFFDKNLVF